MNTCHRRGPNGPRAFRLAIVGVATTAIGATAASGPVFAQSPSPTVSFRDSGAGQGFPWPGANGIVIQGDTVNVGGGCATVANTSNVGNATNMAVSLSQPVIFEISVYAPCDSNIQDWKNAILDTLGVVVNANNITGDCNWFAGIMLDEEFPGYGFSESTINSLNSAIDQQLVGDFTTCSGLQSPVLWGEAFWSAGSATQSDYDNYKAPSKNTYVSMAPQEYPVPASTG